VVAERDFHFAYTAWFVTFVAAFPLVHRRPGHDGVGSVFGSKAVEGRVAVLLDVAAARCCADRVRRRRLLLGRRFDVVLTGCGTAISLPLTNQNPVRNPPIDSA
jgi:hypothetical protein